MKYVFILSSIIVLYILYLVGVAELRPTPTILDNKYVALVKYQDVVYHCYMVSKRQCGYTVRCNGGLWKQCIEIQELEWISKP